MQVRPSSEHRIATPYGTARKRSATAPASDAAPPLPVTRTLVHEQQNILQDTLATALNKHMAKLRKPVAAAPSNSNPMDDISKTMLKARIEMLRKMMALAGNDPGSLRALAQQLAQASRELKSLSGGSSNAALPLPQQPAIATQAEGQTEEAQATSVTLPEAGTLTATWDNAANNLPGENELPDENQTENSGYNTPKLESSGAETQKQEEDPEIKKMLAELKKIRDWLKQQLHGSDDPQAKQALKEVEHSLAAVEKDG